MSGEDLAFRSAIELAGLVRTKQASPVELVRLYLERIDRLDGRLRAYIAVSCHEALAAARQAEAALMAGQPCGPLHGVPFAVKDQFDVKGLPTTMGSRVPKAAPAVADATVVARLRAAGAVLLGKLNLTEFALGGTREFPFGQPCNPWNVEHDPGGSSSGSGIATAAALCAFTLGEDTGGSVRSPAAWCGVVGVRPTWGRVSRAGVFPLSWSMDAAGPLSRTVRDSALVLSVIAGRDDRDPTTSRRPVPDHLPALTTDVSGLRLGVVRELTSGPETHPEVRAAVETAARRLATLGATVEDVSLPLIPLAGAVFMALADSEGAGLHARWLRDRPGDYDAGTRRRLLSAGLLPATLVHQASRARALIRRQVLDALREHDALLAPMAHTAAPPIAAGRAPITSRADVGPRFFTRRCYGSPASLAGVPALSVPCGFSRAGLPIGLQVIGRPFDEATILRVAHAYELASDWQRRRPPM
jgi:Asp-tRNA(Asn)/Glu-tRNA(Gln) amidotransferase A subunit family amidase